MATMSQPWTPRFLRYLAEEHASKAREAIKANWPYTACTELAIADALHYLADDLERKPNDPRFQPDLARLNVIIGG